MEDLFNIMANTWESETMMGNDAQLSQEIIDESIARANDFFGLGNYDGLGMDAHSPLSFEGIDSLVAESYHYEDQFFNPTTFVEMGFSGQDALDLLITHEGTGVMLHDMDVHFDGFQEELCSDYMTGVRAGLAGIDVSQIEYALADIPQELGHANGDFRAEAFLEGVNFANEYMETHDHYPTFSECFEEYNNEHMQDLADLARLDNDMFVQECEMAHYKYLVESQPDNELVRQQYRYSEAKYNDIKEEFENRLAEMNDANNSYNVSFKSHPDNVYTKEEIRNRANDAKSDYNHYKNQVEDLARKIEHEINLKNPSQAKLQSLRSSLNAARRNMEDARSDYNSWLETKPKE